MRKDPFVVKPQLSFIKRSQSAIGLLKGEERLLAVEVRIDKPSSFRAQLVIVIPNRTPSGASIVADRKIPSPRMRLGSFGSSVRQTS